MKQKRLFLMQNIYFFIIFFRFLEWNIFFFFRFKKFKTVNLCLCQLYMRFVSELIFNLLLNLISRAALSGCWSLEGPDVLPQSNSPRCFASHIIPPSWANQRLCEEDSCWGRLPTCSKEKRGTLINKWLYLYKSHKKFDIQ